VNQEYIVRAPTGGGPKDYRVVAMNENQAVFKVVRLCESLHMPLIAEVKVLTPDD